MGRIYFRLPQWSNIQSMLTLRQMIFFVGAAIAIVILVILFTVSLFRDDDDNTTPPSRHFLPTVNYGNKEPDLQYFNYGSSVHYGIVLDCGSSGTRVYVYVWPPHSGDPQDLLSIQQLKDHLNQLVVKKVTPGLDAFVDHPEDASDYLEPLLQYAASNIPKEQHRETLLYILATAGMRLLPEDSQQAILQDLQRDIPKKFDFVIAENNFEVISGKQEGVYAWIAANYALQKFKHGDDDKYEHPLVAVDIADENGERTQHVRRRTVGMLDMGGGSMQIAYEITANADSIPKHLMAEFNLGCMAYDREHTYKVYVTTFLGYGANEARSRYEQQLVSQVKERQAVQQKQAAILGAADPDPVKVPQEPIKHPVLDSHPQDSLPINEQLRILPRVPAGNSDTALVDTDVKQARRKRAVISDVTSVDKLSDISDKRAANLSATRVSSSQLKELARDSGAVHAMQPRDVPAASVVTKKGDNPFARISDPCLQLGLTLPPRDSDDLDPGVNVTFVGTGDYQACKTALEPVLNKTVPCKLSPCSMNGVHQPEISYKNSQFYGFSEFWYTMEDVFRMGGLYESGIFETHAQDFCGKQWDQLMIQYKKGLYQKADMERLKLECFKSAWMTTVLHTGLGFPTEYKGLQSVQLINNHDVQWTLGALIHRTRYLPLREIQELSESKFKPSWLISSHVLYNEYLLVICFIIVVMAIVIYCRRLRLCAKKAGRPDMKHVPSMSYFMTEMDQVESGVRLLNDYSYPDDR